MYALLVCAVWLFYPEFTACSRDSLWCTFCFWTTQSAGRIGTIYVIIAACIFFAVGQRTARGKALVFIRSLLALVVLLSSFAYLNEHLIKTTARIARPSHTFIVKNTKFNSKLDSIYNLTDNNKRAFFKNVISSDTITFSAIDQRILDHWVEEMGYSFPSGHSFNAFLLAGIIAFGIYQNTTKRMKMAVRDSTRMGFVGRVIQGCRWCSFCPGCKRWLSNGSCPFVFVYELSVYERADHSKKECNLRLCVKLVLMSSIEC